MQTLNVVVSTISDIAQIRSLAEHYFVAARQGRSEILAAHIFPTMRVQGYSKGQFVDISGQEFLEFIDKSGPATNLKAEIAAIGVAGTAAHLRMECEHWHGVDYSDLLNLLKIDGTWKVIGKVFDARASVPD